MLHLPLDTPSPMKDIPPMRTWLLSNTAYGTWLPGDSRGSVTSVRDRRPTDPVTPFRFEHDMPGEPWEPPAPGLEAFAYQKMNGSPICFEQDQAVHVLGQFQETALYRGWNLLAVSIMYNHFHIVVEVPKDPDPRKVLADFKAYASRRLNQYYGKPASGTWWTTNGSKRKVKDETHRDSAIFYTLYKQPRPLVVWSPALGRIV